MRVAGVQPQSETVWRQANKYHVPAHRFHQQDGPRRRRFRCVDRLDAQEARRECLADSHSDRQGRLPQGPARRREPQGGRSISTTTRWVPIYEVRGDSGREQGAGREGLRRVWSRQFPTSTTKSPRRFSRRKPITPEMLKAGIRRQTIANKFVPVVGGSAFKNKGVQYLVDAVIDYLPGPLDIPPAVGQDPDTHEPMEAPTDDNGKFCSLAFKLWSDPFVGKLVFFRVYSGTLTKGDNGLQSAHEQTRAHLPSDSDPGRQARGHRHLLLGRHRGHRRHQEHHHGRHALRRGSSDPARAAFLP